MKMKKIVSMFMLTSALLGLAACGSQSDDSANEGTITVMLDSEPGQDDPVVHTMEKWKQETGNDYEILVVGYDDQLTKFPLMIKNDDLPDLLITTRLHKEYPEDFVDLSQEVDMDYFDPDLLRVALGNYNEGIQILPTQITVTNYFYNKEAFEEAGITPPTPDNLWTLEELYENAEKLVESAAVNFGLAVDYSRARYDNLMYSNGGSITETIDGQPVVAVNSPENIATLQKFIEANDEGIAPKNIWAGGSPDNPMNYFENGDVGIYLSGSFNYANIARDAKIEFGVMPSPIGTKQQSALNGGRGWGVPKNSPNAALATEFVKWFYNSESTYQEFLDLDFGLPFMENYTYEPTSTFQADDYQLYVQELANIPEEFLVDEANQWGLYLEDDYRQAMSQAVSGELSAEEALNRVAERIAQNAGWAMKYQNE